MLVDETALAACDSLYVGFSGGLDSTVLLHWLATQSAYQKKVQAIHVHHGLSPHATEWQQHCEQVAKALSIPLLVHTITLDNRSNLENKARMARQAIFKQYIQHTKTALVLAHHQDDQAETLLLHLFRGAGVDGLASMLSVGTFAKGQLIRPLLNIPKTVLLEYALTHKLSWIEDESNQDTHYARNFLRQELMPLLKKRWPEAATHLASTAVLCQEAKKDLKILAYQDCPALAESNNQLQCSHLLSLPKSRLITVIRWWLKNNGLQSPSQVTIERIIDELLLASSDALGEVMVGKNIIKSYQNTLYLLTEKPIDLSDKELIWHNFPHPCLLPNQETWSAEPTKEGLVIPASSIPIWRFRKGGESFHWHGQNKSLKKLWQEWKVPPWERGRVPLLYVDGVLAAVGGYAMSDRFRSSTTFSYVPRLVRGI